MWKRRLIFSILFVISVFIIGFSVYIGIILFGNYTIDEKELVLHESTVIIDKQGEEITRLFEENREIVTIDDIPEYVQHAFISIEDHRFFQHTGVDFWAIGRALYRDIASNSRAEGGSTITQQLAKNTFLSNEKTILRKTKEVLISINLERRYRKDEILEMYLNRIYFGHGAHGIQAASNVYFNKDVKELSVEEGALLAAIPKAPSHYSPFLDAERSKQRRNLVLSTMERRGYLGAEEAVRLQGRTIPSDQTKITENPAHLSYVDLVLAEAEETYRLTEKEVLRGGYTIEVAMNQNMQQTTYDHFQNDSIFPNSTGEQLVQGSVVLLDNETGGVIAAQGGRDFVRKGFNRIQSKRQPGSTYKPVAVYAPAIEEELFHPYSLLTDDLINFDGYSPRNVNQQYQGEITMYDAIKDSANVPAVWTLNKLGIDHAKDYIQKQQMVFEDDGLSIALGGLEYGVTPLQLAAAYRTFANDGKYVKPYFIEKIYDRNGELIASVEKQEVEVLSPQTAWFMTKMLEAVVKEGTGSHGSYHGALAGKTGTTSFEAVAGASRDLWFAGYTPEVSGAIWMGYDRNDTDHYMTESSSVPTIAFKAILSEIDRNKSAEALVFNIPHGVNDLQKPIRLVNIDDLSADASLGFRGLTVQLEWSPSEDERVHYRIYQELENERKLIDEVVGENQYKVRGASLFTASNYVVVPYNPQIEREGEPSNVVQGTFRLFSQGDAS